MLYCLRLHTQILLCSFVVYFALVPYFTPPHPLPPFNKAGLLAWVHTCHFHLHVAGWVWPLPHLSFHSLPGGACDSLVGSSVTLQGVSLPPLLHYSLLECVAATPALLNITRVCHCHPSCLNIARGGGGGYLDQFLPGNCAAALSEPLPHYSLFCGQL